MSLMAQDAIDMGLDLVVGPDGREWCDSIYERPAINKEIWGEGDDCDSFQGNKISLDGHRGNDNYQHHNPNYFSTFEEAKAWAKNNPGKAFTRAPDRNGFIKK